jgi:gamma-glutamyltranspeptidase/glutathione hydrolase
MHPHDRPFRFGAAALALALVLGSGGAALAQRAPAGAPQAGPKSAVLPKALVSAANPLAAEAGLRILRVGGGAVDAAVAVQAVLGLVEPQSSGLGGGAFMIYYDAQTKTVTAYDGRETAPAGAAPDMFMGADGRPLPRGQAVLSGRATGVPGAIAMLAMAHKDLGRRPWSSLFADAERLADQGFPIPRRLAANIVTARGASATPDTTAYFTKPDGTRYQLGETLKNPAYAATIRALAARGPAALLTGPIAQAIVDKTHEAPLPGTMTLADLAGYQPKKTTGLCRPYRVWVVCTPQLPSGGAAVHMILGALAATDIDTRGPADPKGWLQFAEASRLAYADRNQYLGDPAFAQVPLQGLLDPAYLAARGKTIGAAAAPSVTFGRPMGPLAAFGPDYTEESAGTSNFTIVDDTGDVLSMTTTVEAPLGTGRMVGGFILNNELTDFSFAPTGADGLPAANAVAGGKRPRSSMSPTIVLDKDGRFVMAVGTPGGNSIIAYVAKTLVGFLDWELSLPAAIDLPNMIASGAGPAAAVESTFDPALAEPLKALGLALSPGGGEESGLHGAAKVAGGYEGAADERREGIVLGY